MAKTRRREKTAGSLKKIDNKYYLRIRVDGHDRCTLIKEADGTPVGNKERAIELSKDMEVERLVPGCPLLSEAWQAYLDSEDRPQSGKSTLRHYSVAFHSFQAWYGKDRPISDITNKDARDFFVNLWDERNVSGRTYNSYRQSLILVFKVLCAKYELSVNPFAMIQSKPKHGIRHNAFTWEQVEAIFDGFEHGFFYDTEVEVMSKGRARIRKSAQKEYKPMYADEMEVMLLLCCWTGCRCQDACQMRWNNIDMERKTIRYTPKKTAKATGMSVSLPLHPKLYAGLLKAESFSDRNKPGENYVIPNIAERYINNPSGIQNTVQRIIKCATGESTTSTELQGHRSRKANIYGAHSFRHTFISFCANAGVSLEVVASIVGHASVDMTRHYTHISDEAKQNAIDKLATADIKKASNLLKKLEALPEEKINALIAALHRYFYGEAGASQHPWRRGCPRHQGRG